MRNVVVFALMVAVGGCTGTRGSERATDAAADASAPRSELVAAQAKWAADKAGCTTYHYESIWSSFVGTYGTTTIEITNDVATRRSYLVTQRGQTDAGAAPTPLDQWDETGAQVGSHHDGAAALTVEQLFASCDATLGQDPVANRISVAFGEHGVPRACGYVPTNCADDCYTGFTLANFACGPL